MFFDNYFYQGVNNVHMEWLVSSFCYTFDIANTYLVKTLPEYLRFLLYLKKYLKNISNISIKQIWNPP